MKSIHHFVRKAFTLFTIGLVSLGITCVAIFTYHVYKTNLNSLEEVAYRILIQTNSGHRAIFNNILVVENILREQVQNRRIDKNIGNVLAATINYNFSQYNIWFGLDKNFATRMPGKPKGQFFLVVRKPDFYQKSAASFNTPFDIQNYFITLFDHDIYYRDRTLPWYQDPIYNKGEITYINLYFDKIYTKEWLFTFAKAVYNKPNELIGVVGIDFGVNVVKSILGEFVGDFGLMAVESESGTILFDVPSKEMGLIENTKPYKINVKNHFLPLETLRSRLLKKKLAHVNIGGKQLVYKVYTTLSGSWYLIVYQGAWSFYKGIIPFVIILTLIIIGFLVFMLYHLRKSRKNFLNPIEELLRWLKRDTYIIGSNKNLTGGYPASNVIEVNELIGCINTLFEVVNENFQNYRIELDKNIKSKEELEQLVQQRSEQLIEREKMAALGFMSAGLAHEIKNPLNLICNAAEIIAMQLKKIGEVQDENIKRALSRLTNSNQIILNNGLRVDNIVKTLLLQVRDTKEGRKHIVDMGLLVKANLDFVLANYRPKMNNRIFVEFEKPDINLAIKGNPADLGRVFINLIDNSCYAMIKKINNDSLFTANLKVTLSSHDNGIEIKIRDNGIGISKENLNQILIPFYTTKPPGEGTGLGLNFAYEIVKQHGGSLEIFSNPGEFTEVILYFPFKGKI